MVDDVIFDDRSFNSGGVYVLRMSPAAKTRRRIGDHVTLNQHAVEEAWIRSLEYDVVAEAFDVIVEKNNMFAATSRGLIGSFYSSAKNRCRLCPKDVPHPPLLRQCSNFSRVRKPNLESSDRGSPL